MAGDIYLSLAVARFCRVLGTLLHGGVPIVRSLDISAESTGNKVLMAAVQNASENITSGQSLAEPLGKSGHFPKNVVEMIAVAEQSNSLESVLTQIADSLERATWRKLDLTVRLLEPLLLVILAIVVLIVVMALLLPVLKMGTTV
jgi:general secretion pathway protein F/type IV pilus assembly protein PilC